MFSAPSSHDGSGRNTSGDGVEHSLDGGDGVDVVGGGGNDAAVGDDAGGGGGNDAGVGGDADAIVGGGGGNNADRGVDCGECGES